MSERAAWPLLRRGVHWALFTLVAASGVPLVPSRQLYPTGLLLCIGQRRAFQKLTFKMVAVDTHKTPKTWTTVEHEAIIEMAMK